MRKWIDNPLLLIVRHRIPDFFNNIHGCTVISKIDKFKNTSTNKKNNRSVEIDSRENYFDIEIKLHTDMNTLKHVYVIESLNKKEFIEIQKND